MAKSNDSHAPLLTLNDVQLLIQRRIAHLTPKHRARLPNLLRQDPVGWAQIDDGDWASIVFLDADDQVRIRQYGEKGIQPFPGFVTREPNAPSAFRFENSKFCRIDDCRVKNMYALSLGEDCSVTLRDLTIELDLPDGSSVSYAIKLAFVISTGKSIDKNNAINILEDLIAEQIKESDRD